MEMTDELGEGGGWEEVVDSSSWKKGWGDGEVGAGQTNAVLFPRPLTFKD